MEHNNILIVVEKLMQEHHFHCEWGIEWAEKQHFMEIIFQFNLPNLDHYPLTDVLYNEYQWETVPFETKIVLFDEQYLRAEMKHYIKSIPVNQRVGIKYGELVTLVKYLKVITSEVPLRWREFLADPSQAEFKVLWDDAAYEQMRSTIIKTSRYSESAVFFPKHNG